jgi:hypothetical protein
MWSDELFNEKQRDDLGDKRKELAAINEKIEAKGFKSKTEGEKAKFVCEHEIVRLEKGNYSRDFRNHATF